MRRFSALLIALSLAACGGSSTTTSTESTASTETTTGSESAEAAPRFAMVSVDDVATRVEQHDPHLAVFDANGAETYAEHHVPGATWVHYDSITADVLPADHATSLVFYCANEHCSASHTAADTAIDLGYTDVAVMGAGIQGWVDAGKPVETGSPAAAPAQ